LTLERVSDKSEERWRRLRWRRKRRRRGDEDSKEEYKMGVAGLVEV